MVTLARWKLLGVVSSDVRVHRGQVAQGPSKDGKQRDSDGAGVRRL